MPYTGLTRAGLLPPHLHLLIQLQIRLISSSPPPSNSSSSPSHTTPFPFPTHAHPTPHQIFHLPVGASSKDVKSRYYDLVRAHHPDSPHCRHLSASTRHEQFQSITAAYDILTGKSSPRTGLSGDAQYYQELDRRRRHDRRAEWQRSHAGFAHDYWEAPRWSPGSGEDGWKDKLIIVAGILTLAAGFGPLLFFPSYTYSYSLADKRHLSASENLAQARREAREFGEVRRREIRRRVRERELEREVEKLHERGRVSGIDR